MPMEESCDRKSFIGQCFLKNKKNQMPFSHRKSSILNSIKMVTAFTLKTHDKESKDIMKWLRLLIQL